MKKQFTARKPQKSVFLPKLCNKNLKFGSCAIISKESVFITTTQLEAMRRVIMKFLVKSGYLWIRVSHKHNFTAKPKEVRMGKGKGSVDYSVFRISVGQVLFEFYKVDHLVFKNLISILKKKISFSICVVGL
jgi:large subunit ribosomal protein L16